MLRSQPRDQRPATPKLSRRSQAQPRGNRAPSERTTELTRGELAVRTGCNIETIRYYEKAGLLPPPPRTQGGYRLYDHELLKRLSFVRRSRDLGFTIEEVRDLLRMADGNAYTCAQVQAMALDHVKEIRRKVADLRRIEKALATMAAQCNSGDVPECPVIDVLFEGQA